MTDKRKPPVIVWFRRDPRTNDNAALSAAADGGQFAVALYIREAVAGTGTLGADKR